MIGLKDSRQFLSQWEAKPKPIAPCIRVIFPAVWASFGSLLRIVIGSSRCLPLLWLVGVIALVLVFRQSFENRSGNLYFPQTMLQNASWMFICFQHWKRGKGRLPFTKGERRITQREKVGNCVSTTLASACFQFTRLAGDIDQKPHILFYPSHVIWQMKINFNCIAQLEALIKSQNPERDSQCWIECFLTCGHKVRQIANRMYICSVFFVIYK